MRALLLSASAFAAVSLVSVTGPASAAVQQPLESYCNSNAADNNRPPVASIEVTLSGSGTNANRTVTLTTSATDPDMDALSYGYTISGGRINDEGAIVIWDLGGVQPGTYEVSVQVRDARGCEAYVRTSVEVGL